MALITYLVRDDDGDYYAGNLRDGKPICDTDDPDEAIEMTAEELAADFPDGLPTGWEQIERRYK